jgi:hypothetical protein
MKTVPCITNSMLVKSLYDVCVCAHMCMCTCAHVCIHVCVYASMWSHLHGYVNFGMNILPLQDISITLNFYSQ